MQQDMVAVADQAGKYPQFPLAPMEVVTDDWSSDC